MSINIPWHTLMTSGNNQCSRAWPAIVKVMKLIFTQVSQWWSLGNHKMRFFLNRLSHPNQLECRSLPSETEEEGKRLFVYSMLMLMQKDLCGLCKNSNWLSWISSLGFPQFPQTGWSVEEDFLEQKYFSPFQCDFWTTIILCWFDQMSLCDMPLYTVYLNCS